MDNLRVLYRKLPHLHTSIRTVHQRLKTKRFGPCIWAPSGSKGGLSIQTSQLLVTHLRVAGSGVDCFRDQAAVYMFTRCLATDTEEGERPSKTVPGQNCS